MQASMRLLLNMYRLRIGCGFIGEGEVSPYAAIGIDAVETPGPDVSTASTPIRRYPFAWQGPIRRWAFRLGRFFA